MSRLGSVLGAILADLGRARVIADHLSKELVDEYRGNPILASMSVPRVLVDQVELTLRFAVTGLEEAQVPIPDAASVANRWSRRIVASVLPRVLEGHGIVSEKRVETLERLAGRPDSPTVRPSLTAIREGLAGDATTASKAAAEAMLQAWSELPQDVRSRLGSKTAFRRELEMSLASDLVSFIDRERELELVRAALASQVDVGIRPEDLSAEPQQIQELRVVLRGEDVSLIVEGPRGED